MKKKVVSTDYLISVGKISEVTKEDPAQRELFISRILENEAQLADWRETFGIDITEQLPLLEGLYPTLPLDTQHFKEDEGFVDKLLSLFDDLESQIDGVLLNSENFQALDLLMENTEGPLDASILIRLTIPIRVVFCIKTIKPRTPSNSTENTTSTPTTSPFPTDHLKLTKAALATRPEKTITLSFTAITCTP